MMFYTELKALQDLYGDEAKDNPDAWKEGCTSVQPFFNVEMLQNIIICDIF